MRIAEGDWVTYRSQVMAGGKRQESLARIVCLDRAAGTDDETWLLEVLPLHEDPDGSRHPIPGEGVRLRLSRDVLRREGRLLDAIVSAEQWHKGHMERLSPADLHDDPLVSASLSTEFRADTVAERDSTTRVIDGMQFLCGQFVLSAADTQRTELVTVKMTQVTTREIVAAVHPDLPFLGLAFVSERVRSESSSEPPSRRFRPPPPQVRVEIMELLAFGRDAKPFLAVAH